MAHDRAQHDAAWPPASPPASAPKPRWTFRVIFAPMVNDEREAVAYGDAASDLVGEANVRRDGPPGMGSEDFSFMMERVPGAHINLGSGDTAALAQSSIRL